IGGDSLQSYIVRIPLERKMLDFLHPVHPDLEYRVVACSVAPAPVGAATYSTAPTRSGCRLRAQRPWASLRTKWPHEVGLLARRGCRPRAVVPDCWQRWLLAARSTAACAAAAPQDEGRRGGLGHLFKKKMVMPLKI
ncbi:hypothetical protein GW17_00050668, partial [Ensete ventricosum]